METVQKVLVVAAAVIGGLFALAALVAAMTAAPILAAAVVLGMFASVFIMNPDQQVEFLAFIRLMCGEPSAPRLREQSPYAAVRRAAGVDSSYNAADYHHSGATEPKVSPYEARPEGDEKHDAPPLELREQPLN